MTVYLQTIGVYEISSCDSSFDKELVDESGLILDEISSCDSSFEASAPHPVNNTVSNTAVNSFLNFILSILSVSPQSAVVQINVLVKIFAYKEPRIGY